MEIYRVAFIGHRDLYHMKLLSDRLEKLVRNLLYKKEYVEFYVGRNGDFDICVASVIKQLQKNFGTYNSSLNIVLPYHTKGEEFYENVYDEVLLPIESKTHFKAAITKRNEWLVDNSDLLIACVEKESGGAYKTLKYAEKKGRKIINIAKEMEEWSANETFRLC